MKKGWKIFLIIGALLLLVFLGGLFVFQQHFKPSPYRDQPLPAGNGLVMRTEYEVYHKGDTIYLLVSNPTDWDFAYLERKYSVECKLFGKWYLYYEPDAIPYAGIRIPPRASNLRMYGTELPDSFFTFPGEYRIITNENVATFTVE